MPASNLTISNAILSWNHPTESNITRVTIDLSRFPDFHDLTGAVTAPPIFNIPTTLEVSPLNKTQIDLGGWPVESIGIGLPFYIRVSDQVNNSQWFFSPTLTVHVENFATVSGVSPILIIAGATFGIFMLKKLGKL